MRAFVVTVFVVAATCLSSLPSAAQSVGTYPELLRKALEIADVRKIDGMRLRFVRTKLGAPDITMSASFDPFGPDGAQWTVLSPAENSQSKSQRNAIKVLKKQKDSDLELIIDSGAAANLLADDIALHSENESEVVFEASARSLPGGKSVSSPLDPAAIARHLKVQITVDRNTALVKKLRIFAPSPFKPIVAAKIEELDISMSIGAAWAGGPLIVEEVTRVVSGAAFYVEFGDRAQLAYSLFQDARKVR